MSEIAREEAIELKELTDRVLQEIERDRGDCQGDGVNWASFRCTEAATVIPHEGEVYYQVTIIKVSPDAGVFRRRVRDMLEEKFGWDNVEVLTEW